MSRYMPNPGDTGHLRDRSPPRYERRPPADTRLSEGAYDRPDSYIARPSLPRDPPRGPKAETARGSYAPRGRGFGGRGASREQDFREATYSKGRGSGQEWDTRDKLEPRSRRSSPPTRRSRSPYREPRDADTNFRRRDSRDGPPAGADIFPPRGRGGYRGRGRGDWELSKTRSYHAKDRSYGPRSLSRDPQWDSREAGFDQNRRDDDMRNERERDRDERHRNDPVPYRSDSRNSYGASRSTSTTDLQSAMPERPVSAARNLIETSTDYERRSYIPEGRAERSGFPRDPERLDTSRRPDHDRGSSRASSPPAAPSVPAFGSILPQKVVANTQEPPSNQVARSEEEPQIHPSRRALLEPAKDHQYSNSSLINAPTAPKAQQRFGQEDATRASSLGASSNNRSNDGNLESGSNWSKRFSPQNPPLAPRNTITEQPSVRKALEEEGKNGNLSTPSYLKPSNNDATALSPVKIPTGPRAGRGGPPSIRQPMQQPSIRAPMGRGGPPMLGRGRGQPSTWSWHNPQRQAPPRAPSIMNRAPTKREIEAEEEKVHSPRIPQPHTAVEQWRQKHESSLATPGHVPDVKVEDEPPERPDLAKAEDTQSRNEVQPAGNDDTSELKEKVTGKDTVGENDIDMGLDDDDLQISQKKYEREIRLLEARKPANARDDRSLLRLLDELDALALAMKEVAEDVDGTLALRACQEQIEDSRLNQDEEDDIDVGSEARSVESESKSLPGTPPLEGLPFLQESSSTTFSDIDDLKTPIDEDDLVKDFIHARLQDEQDKKSAAGQEACDAFIQSFRPWRRDVDVIEATIRQEHARENSTPPDTALEPTSVPQTVRSRRIVSDYGIEAIMKESVETAAREDQARREREEREAQIYIPVDTCNPEREARVPSMLAPAEAQDLTFMDYNDFIEPMNVLHAFRYMPPRDDFSPKEHSSYLYHYVTMPKRFGEIADKLEGRDYKACVRHYYATKKVTSYRNQEIKFYKSSRGKRHREANERAAGSRPRGGLLAAFDDPPEQGAQSAASLTESGRPRRAAAPTFGDIAEGESIGAPIQAQGRRPTFSKENAAPTQLAERPTARRSKTATGQKPGRKPKGQQLLAAAPPPPQKPSPTKEFSQSNKLLPAEPIIEAPREEEREAAHSLINFPKSLQSFPAPTNFTEHWITGQMPFSNPVVAQEPPNTHRLEQPQQIIALPQPPNKPQQLSETTSYWSVPEKQDFLNYVNYFGTDWAKIAQTMKTKTTQMIKNYYQREIDSKKGEKGRELERAAHFANERRRRNEDMGLMPAPTPAQPKRRYDSNAARENQRPLAPQDMTNVGDESSSVRPAKTRMSPPSLTSMNPRLSASSQAEQKAAASSAQVLAQGPQSPASRGVIHMMQQQQRPQNIQASPIGIDSHQTQPAQHVRHHPEGHRRPTNDGPELLDHSNQRMQQPQQQSQQVQQHVQQLQPNQQQHKEYQNYLERSQREREMEMQIRQADLRQQQQQQELEAREQAVQAQMRQQQDLQRPSFLHVTGERMPLSQYEHTPKVQVDELSRRVLEQRQEQRQEELRRPSEPLHRHSQGNHPPTLQQLVGAATGSSHSRNPSSQSPASSGPLMQALSRLETSRPSPVPVPTSAPPPQPAQPKKTSNIMSLLNSEPEEPKISKRMSDPRAITATPEPSSTAQRFPLANRPPSQQFIRPDTPSQMTTQAQPTSLGQSVPQQQRLEPGLRVGMGRGPGLSMQQLSANDKPVHHFQAPNSQQKFETFLASGSSRPAYLQSRDRGMVSPPSAHSRTPSYPNITQPTQPSISQDTRTSISEVSSGASRLRPSPWAHHTPPQSQSRPQLVPNQQQPHSFNPSQQQRELRPEDHHRRSLESLDTFRSQQNPQTLQNPRQIIIDNSTSRAREQMPRHEGERDPNRFSKVLADHQQQALEVQANELNNRKEREKELLRRQHSNVGRQQPPTIDLARRQQEFLRDRERQEQRGSRADFFYEERR